MSLSDSQRRAIYDKGWTSNGADCTRNILLLAILEQLEKLNDKATELTKTLGPAERPPYDGYGYTTR